MARDHHFSSSEALDDFAAARVGGLLAEALAQNRQATLVVPGGRSPARFLTILGNAAIDWSRVQVTLSDERWVAPTSSDSNEGLIRRTLMSGRAGKARLVPLLTAAPTPADAVAEVSARLGQLPRPLDVVVLGMGADGHFASLFPGAESLRDGLDPAGKAVCLAAEGPADSVPRLSLTLSLLTDARQILVVASGDAKRSVWQLAGNGAPYPVGALQRQNRAPVDFLWCP
jgi:6-phosphogluconolactonase